LAESYEYKGQAKGSTLMDGMKRKSGGQRIAPEIQSNIPDKYIFIAI